MPGRRGRAAPTSNRQCVRASSEPAARRLFSSWALPAARLRPGRLPRGQLRLQHPWQACQRHRSQPGRPVQARRPATWPVRRCALRAAVALRRVRSRVAARASRGRCRPPGCRGAPRTGAGLTVAVDGAVVPCSGVTSRKRPASAGAAVALPPAVMLPPRHASYWRATSADASAAEIERIWLASGMRRELPDRSRLMLPSKACGLFWKIETIARFTSERVPGLVALAISQSVSLRCTR